MAVLSIIACGMLEDELVHVLSKDSELKQLIVVEDRDNFGFRRKLKIDTGLANNSEFNENVQEYARTYGMKIIDLKGSVEIAEQSDLAARNVVTVKQ
jgi:hypothetical protein